MNSEDQKCLTRSIALVDEYINQIAAMETSHTKEVVDTAKQIEHPYIAARSILKEMLDNPLS